MSEQLKQQIMAVLGDYQEPHLGMDLVAAKAVKQVAVDNDRATLDLEFGFPVVGIVDSLKTGLSKRLLAIDALAEVTINISAKIISHAVQQGLKGLPGVKNMIAVASGKGGVGKSTTAVNLALALHKEGARVGILDADIYGPSLAQMLGVSSRPETKDNKGLLPINCYGIQSMSISYLIDQKDTPMVWRGPMATRALKQLLQDTLWDALDYLIIDLPPGTGDIQLTLVQSIPVSGALIITTPQDIALLDARKGLRMFTKVKVPILGVIENMGIHICVACGHQEHIFGHGGGQEIAQQYNVDFLGSFPLDSRIREQTDRGKPTVVAEPEGDIAKMYYQVARTAAARLSLLAVASKFPHIVVEDK